MRRAFPLLRDRGGVSALEFALIFMPVLLLTAGALELGLMMMMDATLEIAIRTASRTASITAIGTEAERKAKVESVVSALLGNWIPASGEISIETYVYPTLADINSPTWIDSNSNGICDSGEGTCTGVKLTPGVGISGSLVLYSVTATRAGMTGILKLMGHDSISVSRQTVVLNE